MVWFKSGCIDILHGITVTEQAVLHIRLGYGSFNVSNTLWINHYYIQLQICCCVPCLLSSVTSLCLLIIYSFTSSHSKCCQLDPAVGLSCENTELRRFPFKAWSRSVYNSTCYTYCQEFLPCLFLHFQSIHLHFFQNLFKFFLCWLWLAVCLPPHWLGLLDLVLPVKRFEFVFLIPLAMIVVNLWSVHCHVFIIWNTISIFIPILYMNHLYACLCFVQINLLFFTLEE